MKQKLRLFLILSITYFGFCILVLVSWVSANTSVSQVCAKDIKADKSLRLVVCRDGRLHESRKVCE